MSQKILEHYKMSDFQCYFETAFYILASAPALIQINANRDIHGANRSIPHE